MLLTAARQNPFAAGSIGHLFRGHPFQVRNLDRSEKVLSHQKNPISRLAQKLVGLSTLVLLAVSFGPRPAAGGQKSASEVAKSKEAAGLLLAKETLTKAVTASFNEEETKKFFEGWTDSDWESFLQKTPGFIKGALNLNAGDPDLEQLQQELYKKHSKHLTGAIAETFHWVQWRKKLKQIAKDEEYTEVEFLDEKALMTIFGKIGGQRCDGIAIAKNNGNPPKRVILGVFESKVSARQVDPIQIRNFLVRIQDYYRNQDVSLIRLNQGQTKLIQNINDFDSVIIIEAAKEFHKEAARFLTGKDSIHFLFQTVSLDFASNVMRQTPEQKKKLFDISLPLQELAEFIRDNKRFPRQEGTLEGEQKLARRVRAHFEEYEKEIKDYLTGPGGIEEAKLDWMLEVRAARWKKELPDLAEFIRVNKRFPRQKGNLDGEVKLGPWMSKYFPNEKKKPEILAYLSGPGGIDEDTLKWALAVRVDDWKKQLPDLAEFIRDNKRFPTQGNDASAKEIDLALWVGSHFNSEKKSPEILAYLEERVDEAVLKKALDARKPKSTWRDQLPDLAKFIRDKKRFPNLGKDALKDERDLATFLNNHFNNEKKKPEILAYLEERVDEAVLKKALEDFEKNKKGPRKTKVPATDANPDLGECDDELKRIIRELSPTA